jgi:Response regulators consisting of a CheY-like receiver domain and a winged-helix DNA-binding domain
MANILLIDDEKEIADLVEYYLLNENMTVYKYYNPTQALNEVDNALIDLAIIDILMPDIDGFEVCKIIRQNYTYPIIMLTAKVEDIDKIKGLTIGADDYITKPFNPLEVVARVKAQLRRVQKYDNLPSTDKKSNVIDFAGLYINKDTRQCVLNEEELQLTPIEFNILWYLCEHRGRVISSEELFEIVWGEKFLDRNNTVVVHIRNLREKMREVLGKPKYIKTIWGVGYKIE